MLSKKRMAMVQSKVRKGLEAQVDSVFAWEEMIECLDLDQEECEYAKEHISYDIKII